MAIVVTFRVPQDVCAKLVPGYGTPAADALTAKQAMRYIVERALEEKLDPVETEVSSKTPIERINISLSNDLAAQLRALSKTCGVPESIVCQRLILSYASAHDAVPPEKVPDGCELLEQAWMATGLSARVTQAQVFLNVRGTFEGGQIALVEAATGVGKTLAMLLAAEQCLRDHPGVRVVIAVPTIALMRQFADTYGRLHASVSMHPLHAVFGRREFVNREALLELIKNPKYFDAMEAIERWVELEGVPLPQSPFQKQWLASTLKQISPTFPVAACCLSDTPDEDDPGFQSYLEQFDHEARTGSEIVLCTHAMLGYSTKQRHWVASRNEEVRKLRNREIDLMLAIRAEEDEKEKKKLLQALREIEAERIRSGAEVSEHAGKLPPFGYLIIDEAHQFEAAMASANASYLSLRDLLRAADYCHKEGYGITAAKVAAIRAGIDRLQSISVFAKGESVTLSEHTNAAEQVRATLAEILDACCVGRGRNKDSSRAAHAKLREIEYAKIVLRAAINIRSSNQHAIVRFSPVRAYPQLYVGASRADGLMGSLWGAVSGAACVSATLLIPKAGGGHSSYHHKRLLSIPDGRFHVFAPINPSWLNEAIVEVHPPGTDPRLCPPSRGDKLNPSALQEAERKWLEAVSAQVEAIHANAAGGLLVLMTSYHSIHVISTLLSAQLRPCAVFGSADATLAEQAIAFLRLRMAGKKAVWFATGGAWTGLDIGGHEPIQALLGLPQLPAEEDNVLTDVVIPRLPFGLNKSVTHEYRIRNEPATPWEIIDMVLRLKQGIGRLVRRAGLPHNRRIHLLDARIHRESFKMIRERIMLLLVPYL